MHHGHLVCWLQLQEYQERQRTIQKLQTSLADQNQELADQEARIQRLHVSKHSCHAMLYHILLSCLAQLLSAAVSDLAPGSTSALPLNCFQVKSASGRSLGALPLLRCDWLYSIASVGVLMHLEADMCTQPAADD